MRVACLLMVCGLTWAGACTDVHSAEGDAPALELRWQLEEHTPQSQGPLAQALALQPHLTKLAPRVAVAQAELRHSLTLPLPTALPRTRLGMNLLARHEWPEGMDSRGASRVNELHLSTEVGAFGFTAGKKVLGWDVGYAFRPNDVVQQEERRSLVGTTPEGRSLVQVEWFGAESALAAVWVNPQTHGQGIERAPGAEESALALRSYHRSGPLDLHGFARQGDRTGLSLGAATSWVPGESTEWHASLRWLRRHEVWRMAPLADADVVASNPWARTLSGHAMQALVGLNWTGAAQQSVLVEAWHDSTAPSNAQWRDWGRRNAALLASSAPAAFRAGNLAWQTSPMNGTHLRRDNVLVRVAWQPPSWQVWADLLWHPADRGRSVSAGVQWQGARLRLNGSVRQFDGPGDSLLAQTAWRRQWLLTATLSL